jgi:hypothetical protein
MYQHRLGVTGFAAAADYSYFATSLYLLVSLAPPPPSQIIHTSRLSVAGFTTAADGFYSAMVSTCGRLIAKSMSNSILKGAKPLK